jgi:glycerol kinase
VQDLILAIDQGTTGDDGAGAGRGAGRARARVSRVSRRSIRDRARSSTIRGDLGIGHGRDGDALKGVDPKRIAAIGITNQRETTLIWDRADGRPVATRSSGRTGGPRRCAPS